MKRKNTKLDKISIYSKLVKEGFTLGTLLKFNNHQLVSLHNKLIKEQVTTEPPTKTSHTDSWNLKDAAAKSDFENTAIRDLDANQDVHIDADKDVATITTVDEQEEVTQDNKPIAPVKKVSPDGQVSDQEILELSKNEFDMYETIMYGGAGDFDETSFYNPDAGGFSTSQGPADSYYSTDNREDLIGAGTGQDEGQYTGNAKYLDTPSFHNPDASGFDSEGPRDSYGRDDFDAGGFAGELNELGVVEPKFSFTNPVARGHNSDGPMGYSSGLHEQGDDDELVKTQKDVAGMDTDQDAPQRGPDNDSDADDGMGMFEHTTKKKLIEVAVSEKQFNFYQMVKACKESNYKDCGDGRNNQAVKKAAKEMTPKQIKDYTDTPNPNKLPKSAPKTESIEREMVENWLMRLVEKYERPSMTKGQFLDTINEIAVMDAPAIPKTKPGTKPGIKPGTTPGAPDPYDPYQPKIKPKPKAEDKVTTKLPEWLQFDALFINPNEQ